MKQEVLANDVLLDGIPSFGPFFGPFFRPLQAGMCPTHDFRALTPRRGVKNGRKFTLLRPFFLRDFSAKSTLKKFGTLLCSRVLDKVSLSRHLYRIDSEGKSAAGGESHWFLVEKFFPVDITLDNGAAEKKWTRQPVSSGEIYFAQPAGFLQPPSWPCQLAGQERFKLKVPAKPTTPTSHPAERGESVRGNKNWSNFILTCHFTKRWWREKYSICKIQ